MKNIGEMRVDELDSLQRDLTAKAVCDIFNYINMAFGHPLAIEQSSYVENTKMIQQRLRESGECEEIQVLTR